MKNRYIVFDAETPNYANRRMSAIGLTVIENGAIVQTYDTLVDPETHFEPFHIQLTGITPEMIKEKPTFPLLWEELAPVFDSGILVAHNASFDLSVLSKCLLDYGIAWRPEVLYACTCQVGRRMLPQLPNHKLDTLCSHLHVSLHHHRAGSDSRACGEILLHYLQNGADVSQFLRSYDLLHTCTMKKKRAPAGPR